MKRVTFAVCTDLHFDKIPDGERRLEEFLDTVRRTGPDFIVQLGDFCYPLPENRFLLERLEATGLPCCHVLGNHDSDVSSQQAALAFYGLSRSYYSFIRGGIKFLVLDGCYIERTEGAEPYGGRNYAHTADRCPVVPDEQLVWLEEELGGWCGDAVVFSHHSLINAFARRGIANRQQVRAILERGTGGGGRVLLAMNGHDHGDHAAQVNGIWYYTLNAMSYIWHGMKEMYPYPQEVHDRYPRLKDLILYRNGLHTVVTIEPDGAVSLAGMQSGYLHIAPADVGIRDQRWNDISIEPVVSPLRIP